MRLDEEKLAQFGWDGWFRARLPEGTGDVARVAVDDGVAYVVWHAGGERDARLGGRLLRAVRARQVVRPVVGDWLVVSSEGVVEALLPRRTRLARKAAGLEVEQVMAANIDVAFIAVAADADVNERRLERYLAIVHEGGATPVVLLTKADSSPDIETQRARLERVADGIEIVTVSARTGIGVVAVANRLTRGQTGMLIGSSGVGKSTLLNRLVGDARQRIGATQNSGKGRHTTTRRELFALPNGTLLVDTPGMREIGLMDAQAALADTFADVASIAERCKFRDCKHGMEPGCAVPDAVARGVLSENRLQSWRKLRDEMSARAKKKGPRG